MRERERVVEVSGSSLFRYSPVLGPGYIDSSIVLPECVSVYVCDFGRHWM